MFPWRPSFRVPFLLAVFASFPVAAYAAQSYTVTAVFTINSPNDAHAINANATVAGIKYSCCGDGFAAGFRWQSGAELQFEHYPEGMSEHTLVAINDAGTVAGRGLFSGEPRAVLGAGTQLAEIGIPSSEATDIDPLGNVVGNHGLNSPSERGFWWAADGWSGYVSIGTLGGSTSRAYGINASGVIVGEAATTGNLALHAYRAADPSGPLTDLGTLGGANSVAVDINDAGVAVGSAQDATGTSYPVAFREGAVVQLGSRAGLANAINDHGVVVGVIHGIGAFRAIDGVVEDLNELIPSGEWRLWEALDINPSGQIVGFGEQRVGTSWVRRGFLLSPVVVAVGPGGAAARLGLQARPSVTSGPARLDFGRPLETSGRLELFDLAGRALRAFDLAAGTTGIEWDGRDEAGRPAKAGCVLARMRTGGIEARARLFVVR